MPCACHTGTRFNVAAYHDGELLTFSTCCERVAIQKCVQLPPPAHDDDES
jgi:hypothetical protein